MYTGTLIEDLFAAVERAEARASADTQEVELWMGTIPESADDSKLVEVA